MTQFAIFYELGDLSSIAGSVQAGTLSNTLKQRVKKYWDAGLNGWASAPLGAAPGDTSSPLSHILVVNNPTGSLADFRQLLLDVAAALGGATGSAQYLITLSNDMGGTSGAVEPWPPA